MNLPGHPRSQLFRPKASLMQPFEYRDRRDFQHFRRSSHRVAAIGPAWWIELRSAIEFHRRNLPASPQYMHVLALEQPPLCRAQSFGIQRRRNLGIHLASGVEFPHSLFQPFWFGILTVVLDPPPQPVLA